MSSVFLEYMIFTTGGSVSYNSLSDSYTPFPFALNRTNPDIHIALRLLPQTQSKLLERHAYVRDFVRLRASFGNHTPINIVPLADFLRVYLLVYYPTEAMVCRLRGEDPQWKLLSIPSRGDAWVAFGFDD